MKAHLPTNIPYKVRKALQDEINRQTAENVQKLSVNIQALVLWSLRKQLGFGKKRLLRFQKTFLPLIEELQDYYEAEDAAQTEYIVLRNLKNEVGIDVRELDTMFKLRCKINN